MLRASASSLNFTSIYPAPSHLPPEEAPYAFMLEVDGVRVLLDCGWEETFDPSYLIQIRPFAQQADAVLLSSPEMRACGALPYVLTHLPPHAVVVAASSTAKMGLHAVLHTFLYRYANEHTFCIAHDATVTAAAAAAQEPTAEETFVLSVDHIYSAFRLVREPYGDTVSIRGPQGTDAVHSAANVSEVEMWTSMTMSGGAVPHPPRAGHPDRRRRRRAGRRGESHTTTTTTTEEEEEEENEDGVELTCRCIFAGRMLGGYCWLIRYHVDEVLYCADFSLQPSSMLRRFVVPTTANVVLLADFAMHRRGGLRRTDVLRLTDRAGHGHRGNDSTTTTTTTTTTTAHPSNSPHTNTNHHHSPSSTNNTPLCKGLDKAEEPLQIIYRHMQRALRSGSGVLIPVDIAGRGVEVLHRVTRVLREQGGGAGTYTIVFAGLQAKEVLEKAATTTEALQDEIILSERGLFAEVRTCRTAAEVMAMPAGPMVCLADGVASLRGGVAAELLEHFVPAHVHGGQNLILLPPLPPLPSAWRRRSAPDEAAERPYRHGTEEEEKEEDGEEASGEDGEEMSGGNAARLAGAEEGEEVELRVVQRVRLNKEELEAYYLRQEAAVEARRREMEEAAAAAAAAARRRYGGRGGRRAMVGVASDSDTAEEYRDEDAAAGHEREDSDEEGTTCEDEYDMKDARMLTNTISSDKGNSHPFHTDGPLATRNDTDPSYTPRSHVTVAPADSMRKHTHTPHDAVPSASAAAASSSSSPRRRGNTPGLVLPPHLHLRSRHLHFPLSDTAAAATLHAAAMHGENVVYGLPVSDAEQFVLRARAPTRLCSDAGPEELPRLDNDAQREANAPAKMVTRHWRVRRHCRVEFVDWSGHAEAAALRAMLRSRLTFAKKLVGLRGSAEDGRRLAQFCRTETRVRCGGAVFIPTHAVLASAPAARRRTPVPIALATQVYSYRVQLHPATTHALARTLRRVRERGAAGAAVWEVGWVNGELCGRGERHGAAARMGRQGIWTEETAQETAAEVSETEVPESHDGRREGADGTTNGHSRTNSPATKHRTPHRNSDSQPETSIERSRDTRRAEGGWDGHTESRAGAGKRATREEEPLSLSLLHGPRAQRCARHRQESGLESGSFFVGNLDLARLRDQTRRESGLCGEFHKKAPMLVYEEGICVRKGSDGTLTVSAMADASMFDLRRSVYKQYAQIL